MIKHPGLLFFLLLFYAVAQGQVISGRVTTAAGELLPNVSVSLLRDSLFITGDVTDNKGKFHLNTQFLSGASYMIRLSLVGYENTTQSFVFPDTSDLYKLQMQTRLQLLGEVKVVSKKPLVSRKA